MGSYKPTKLGFVNYFNINNKGWTFTKNIYISACKEKDIRHNFNKNKVISLTRKRDDFTNWGLDQPKKEIITTQKRQSKWVPRNLFLELLVGLVYKLGNVCGLHLHPFTGVISIR